ncbi:MAG TPA: radical SAM protein [candidate division Zixibacteria bacterium]|nr:radical SAM protein [candidate division Zixibacteria bacterium]
MSDQLLHPETGAPLDMQPILAPLEQLRDCTCCPRDCHADRFGGRLGFCQSGTGFSIGSICAHRGEEPVVSGVNGICNIFFTRCNMQCVYCQNFQISRREGEIEEEKITLPEIVRQIESILDRGSHAVGFVSPSHFIPQVRVIMNALAARGRKPTYVFNTSSYDKVETIKSFDGIVDVWLPDLKYLDEKMGRAYSDTPNYPEVACAAIKEMFYQKGSSIRLDDNGCITSGLIIRHLVLPGRIENSKKILQWISTELSSSVHVSLMSQYHPTPLVASHPRLGRTLTTDEYDEILEEFDRLGFYRGWIQELDSPSNYRPDFTFDHPFER